MADISQKAVAIGRHKPKACRSKQTYSLPAGAITLEEAVQLICEKQQVEAERHLKSFEEDPELEVRNGRYGSYLIYKGTNYRLTKAVQERAKDLTYEECMAIVKEQDEKPKSASAKRRFAKRK